MAQHYEGGAKKYGDRNWELGQPIARFMDSSLRHGFAYLEGLTDEDHLAAMVWNGLAAIEMEERVAAGMLPEDLLFVPTPPAQREIQLELPFDDAAVEPRGGWTLFNDGPPGTVPLGSIEVGLPDPPKSTSSAGLRTDVPPGTTYDDHLDLYRAPDGTAWAKETLGGRTVYREWVPVTPDSHTG